jgi:formylglycine-generating enzyme required for sulfatase activity
LSSSKQAKFLCCSERQLSVFVPLSDIQISIWETRVQDYEAFCRATGRRYELPDFNQTPTDPAVKVSWFDAVAFCKWLTEKEQDENLIDDREAYRLPTDAEWSMAVGLVNESGSTPEARDGKIKNEFPWGVNNGLRQTTQEIMRHREGAAAQRCPLQVPSPIR